MLYSTAPSHRRSCTGGGGSNIKISYVMCDVSCRDPRVALRRVAVANETVLNEIFFIYATVRPTTGFPGGSQYLVLRSIVQALF